MGLLDKGPVFDWISPTLAEVKDLKVLASGTLPADLHISWPCSISGRDIMRLLTQKGIENWGGMIVKNTLLITVKRRDKEQAREILAQEGIPVSN
jgi:hypothetical protein